MMKTQMIFLHSLAVFQLTILLCNGFQLPPSHRNLIVQPQLGRQRGLLSRTVAVVSAKTHRTTTFLSSTNSSQDGQKSKRRKRRRVRKKNDAAAPAPAPAVDTTTTSEAEVSVEDDAAAPVPVTSADDVTAPEPAPAPAVDTATSAAEVAEEDIAVEQEDEAQQQEELSLRPDSTVSFQVQDVRDLVAGGGTSSLISSETALSSTSAVSGGRSTSSSTTTSTSPSGLDDSLEKMLADAREMKSLESADGEEDDGDGLGFSIGKALSIVVTADFFFVLLLLLWFLAGIFSSYVLNDDTIQIAFNTRFEALVQPALGVLMIASLASTVFKEEEEDE